ncbi:glycosyltransferase family 2 protein [Virgisporangium aurantiacum]|uniref:Glycosyl transferase family 2 n=1 Tax=Virgisporangium aurantiacum TaxID=175570 RepID=A0A8J3ZML8_9ACTN|nr:glycosyltransferase family 2 protein [Virgisporangium aurantiacum]GIJ64311.1 hypothetical protein Vau01_118270 [Virgisporangium aurantiacum]
MIHLVAVVGGGDSLLLSHFVDHYRGLGVESFFLIRHAETTAEPAYEEIASHARAAGVSLYRTHVGPWNDNLHGRLMSAAMAEHPDDWYVLADLDEFHLYDRPLRELVGLCERMGKDHVCGCYVDRIGPGGTLPPVRTGALWPQFPLGGAVTSRLLCAPSVKVGLALGRRGTGGGHHGVPGRTGMPGRRSYIQVHHFKWTASLPARMRRRMQRYENGDWELVYPSVLDEAKRVLRFLRRQGGRIDVADRRLLVDECGPGYDAYRPWPKVVRDARRWNVIFR